MSSHGHDLQPVKGYEGCCHCPACDGFEGSLPTECPGQSMPGSIQDRVYAGDLDFKDGRWCVGSPRTGTAIRFPGKRSSRAWRTLARANAEAQGLCELPQHEFFAATSPVHLLDPWSADLSAALWGA